MLMLPQCRMRRNLTQGWFKARIMKLPQWDESPTVVTRSSWVAGDSGRVAPAPIDDAVQQASQASAELNCQEATNAKAFMGRGSLRALRLAVASLDGVEARMKALSASSKTVVDTRIYLVVHRRGLTGYVFLRWRARMGGNRHLPWDEADRLIADHPPVQQRWCAEASRLAQQLNSEHLLLREALKTMRRLRATTVSYVYARALPANDC